MWNWLQGEKKGPAVRVDSLVGAQTRLHGDVMFTGGVHVDGMVKGNVIADETDAGAALIVSERGAIEGEVRVPNVVINGMVAGDVHASSSVELASSAKVMGNIYYNRIKMAMGAQVNGQLFHIADSASLPPPARQLEQRTPGEDAPARVVEAVPAQGTGGPEPAVTLAAGAEPAGLVERAMKSASAKSAGG